jgi:hypothetical protein
VGPLRDCLASSCDGESVIARTPVRPLGDRYCAGESVSGTPVGPLRDHLASSCDDENMIARTHRVTPLAPYVPMPIPMGQLRDRLADSCAGESVSARTHWVAPLAPRVPMPVCQMLSPTPKQMRKLAPGA